MSRRPTPRPPRSAFITAEGRQRLEQEYQRLWSVERPKLAREVGEAAALGDRSENAEYIYGKKKLREIDKRLGFLNDRIERSVAVDPATLTGDRVVFGATVTVEDSDSGKISTWSIVGEDEIEVPAGRISLRSPV